jgi:sugar-specific transcriptional regulator TrmB
MTDVIAGLRRELEERLSDIERELKGIEGLVRERDRIQAALAQAPFAAERPARARATARRTPSRKSARPRAPRGANLDAVLSAVGERPGVTAATIADVTKISRAVTYNTLAKLVDQGKLEKTQLPGGQTGYKTAAPTL